MLFQMENGLYRYLGQYPVDYCEYEMANVLI